MHIKCIARCLADSKHVVNFGMNLTVNSMWKCRIQGYNWTGDEGKSKKLANFRKRKQEFAFLFFFSRKS